MNDANYRTKFRPKAFRNILILKDRRLFPLFFHNTVIRQKFRYLRSNGYS